MKPAPTWQQCLDAGMNALQAAEARGRSPFSAYAWASKHGVKFPPAPRRGPSCPCRINGTLYPSQAASARVLGVSRVTIAKLLDDGLDSIVPGKWRTGNRNARRSITLFGREFPSHKAAAGFLGLKDRQFRRMRKEGRQDELLAIFLRRSADDTRKAMKAAQMVDGPSLDAYREGGRTGGLLNRRIAP